MKSHSEQNYPGQNYPGDNYPRQSCMKPIDVVILGDRGVVGTELKRLISKNKRWNLVGLFRRKSGQSLTSEERGVELFTDRLQLAQFLRGKNIWVLSALPTEAAEEIEPFLRDQGAKVLSNASFARMQEDVPLWYPGYDQKKLLSQIQAQQNRCQGGFIACQSNCCVALIVRALHPLLEQASLDASNLRAHFVTMQSLSGAGMRGPLALQLVGNVLLDIPHEAKKIGPELKKMCPKLEKATITAQCHRVPTIRGHIVHFSLSSSQQLPSVDELKSLYHKAQRKDLRYFFDPRPLDLYKAEPCDFLEKDDGFLVQLSSLQLSEDHRTLYGTMIGDNLHMGAAGGVLSMVEELVDTGAA